MKKRNDEDDTDKSNSFKSLAQTSPSDTVKLKGEIEENNELPSEIMLDIIVKKLDIDDLFQFAGVCKSWKTIHEIFWRNFMASQAPLLVQAASFAKKTCFLISILEQKVYHTKLDYFWGLSFLGSFGGYLMMACPTSHALLLRNPFTRRKKTISLFALRGKLDYTFCHALLTFVKDSEEFVIVLLCESSHNLHVYQSRNSSWNTYLTKESPWKVVDFVVLNYIIYVVTNKAEIGVISLNYPCVKFLDVKNTPNNTKAVFDLKLVNSDGQLLVVDFEPEVTLNVYKVDFSTMEYVKLETLGNIALFYASLTSCYALSNPGRYGFENSFVYSINCSCCTELRVYSEDNKQQKFFVSAGMFHGTTRSSRIYWMGWCFRCLRDEVDYTLVE